MIEIERLARKEHSCHGGCGFPIIKKGYYLEIKGRVPIFDRHDDQIGIEYIQWRYHRDCLENPWHHEKHECFFKEEIDYQDCGAPTGFEFFIICGKKRAVL